MKEFEKRFDSEDINGLRVSSNMPRDSMKLAQCFNTIPTEYGLESYDPVINPLITTVTFNWPFPQIFMGKRRRIVMDKDKVYSINFDWSLTLELDLSAYYTANPTWDYSIWHLADFYTYVVISNENLVIIYNTVTSSYEVHSATSTIPVFTTMTNFNGQAVAGNITSSWYDADDNSTIWSKIGSMDFLPDQYNTSGYRPMPWDGEVLKIMKLGEGVIVYGDEGILLMRPAEQYWSFKKLANYGIAGRGAVNGDETNHVFVDTNGFLRKISAGGGIEKLGYQEFFSPMLLNDIVISHSGYQNRFSIGDGSTSYILSNEGLGKIDQAITSMSFYSGGNIGIVSSINDNNDYIIESHIFDFRFRGIKTLTMQEYSVNSDDECFAAVAYRYDKKVEFKQTPWVRLNKEGVVYVPTGGIDFKWLFKCEDYTNVNLDHVIIKFKTTDKRYIRGAYNAS